MPPVSIPTEQGTEMSAPKTFWQSLSEVPFMLACQESLHKHEKEGSWIGIGISFFTTGVRTVLVPAKNKLTETFPNAASTLESSACHMLENAKEKHTFMQESPEEILSSIQTSTQKTVRRAFSTSIGMQFVKGLDAAITTADSLLDRLEKKEPEITDEKPKETDKDSETQPSKEPINKLQWLVKFSKERFHMLVEFLLIQPLEIWRRILKSIRAYIAGRPKTGHRLTPEKAREIKQRKMKSPKKRVHSSWLGRNASNWLSWMGFSSLAGQTDIRIYLSKKDNSPNKNRRHDKRKHGDISNEESQESETLDDLQNDMGNYKSDEDPDYKPGKHDPEDSLEYQSGDTESDIEEEPQSSPSKIKKPGKKLVQIKAREKQDPIPEPDKTITHPLVTSEETDQLSLKVNTLKESAVDPTVMTNES